jgi:DNA replication protein DnaC
MSNVEPLDEVIEISKRVLKLKISENIAVRGPLNSARVPGLSLHGQWTQEFERWRIREIPESLAEQNFTPEVSVTLIGNLPIANWQDENWAQCDLQSALRERPTRREQRRESQERLAKDRSDVIALGNSWAGKTHIALGLGLAACQKGIPVGFTTAAALVNELLDVRLR